MMTVATVAAIEETDHSSVTFEKLDAEDKGCRKKRLASAMHSPFTNLVRKKRTLSVSHDSATPAHFDPTKPVALEDVKALIQFCTTWKSNISAELQLEAFPVGTSFFYKLIDATEWMSSKHIDMATFLIRKRQFCHLMVFGTNWTTADYHIQVLYDMHFYERSEDEEVKKWVIENPNFMPFTMCSVGDVPQQVDGASCGIMTVKFIECLSAGIPLHTIDPSKCAYYRLKLAIEALREEAYL